MIFLQTCDVFQALCAIVCPVDPLFFLGVTPVKTELLSWHFRLIYRLQLQSQIVQNEEIVTANFII
jgi:uncharacterized membrane protein YfbV (UPF0208 family)